MAESIDNQFSFTVPVVMTFPNLIEPRVVGKKGATGKPKFGASFLFAADSADLVAIKALAARVAREKWAGRAFTELKFPFENGDAVYAKKPEKNEHLKGKVILKARSLYQPKLGSFATGKLVEYSTPAAILAAKDQFYAGAEALAQVSLVAYEGVGGNQDGVTAYLASVCVTGKGTRIAGGGQSMAEAFKGYVGAASAEDPTGAAGDEIPL